MNKRMDLLVVEVVAPSRLYHRYGSNGKGYTTSNRVEQLFEQLHIGSREATIFTTRIGKHQRVEE
ncbi:Uncharacterized protein APZ42_002039 [Daphnia magna]|uniref:Uncharacterized protein n=1 Tax=Daphnia magna TaxID=35525 RepID=A0A164IK23_9CRUS|nr:Uncharacterized protein APZ42_002039 [Daphnia magna]